MAFLFENDMKNHRLNLMKPVYYYNALVDINGNVLKKLFFVHNDLKDFIPWVSNGSEYNGYGFVYKIQNRINHKIYIGQTEDVYARKNKHVYDLYNNTHANIELQLDFHIFGKSSFLYEVIEMVKYPENSKDRETFFIKEYNSEWPNGYNSPVKNSPIWKEYSKRPAKEYIVDYCFKTPEEKHEIKFSLYGDKYGE